MKKLDISPDKLGFGIYFTDHMFVLKYNQDKGWHDGCIVDYGPLQMDPDHVYFTIHRKYLRV